MEHSSVYFIYGENSLEEGGCLEIRTRVRLRLEKVKNDMRNEKSDVILYCDNCHKQNKTREPMYV